MSEEMLRLMRPYGIPADDWPPVGNVGVIRDGKLVATGWLDRKGQLVLDVPEAKAGDPFWLTSRGREELTPREERSLGRVAIYRGLAGKYGAAIRDAIDQLPEGTPARSILERALEEG